MTGLHQMIDDVRADEPGSAGDDDGLHAASLLLASCRCARSRSNVTAVRRSWSWSTCPFGIPAPGEVRVRHHAIGVNFIDTYFRTGPVQGAAAARARRRGRRGRRRGRPRRHAASRVGDRVAYAANSPGSYAEQRTLEATQVVKLPDAIEFEHRRRDDAEGPDRAVPAAPHAAAGRARAPATRSCGTPRPAASA